jgi:hypothetical protein
MAANLTIANNYPKRKRHILHRDTILIEIIFNGRTIEHKQQKIII